MNGLGDERLHKFGLSHRRVFGKVRRIQCDTHCFRRTALNLGNATKVPSSDNCQRPVSMHASYPTSLNGKEVKQLIRCRIEVRGANIKVAYLRSRLEICAADQWCNLERISGSTLHFLEIRGPLSSAMRLFRCQILVDNIVSCIHV